MPQYLQTLFNGWLDFFGLVLALQLKLLYSSGFKFLMTLLFMVAIYFKSEWFLNAAIWFIANIVSADFVAAIMLMTPWGKRFYSALADRYQLHMTPTGVKGCSTLVTCFGLYAGVKALDRGIDIGADIIEAKTKDWFGVPNHPKPSAPLKPGQFVDALDKIVNSK